MGDYLSAGEVPGIDDAQADELINELETHLSLHYPLTTLSAAAKKQLKALMIPIVRRWDEGGTGLVTQTVGTNGPFGETERKSGGGGHILKDHEKILLRKLCGLSTGPASSRGSFPAPEPIDDMFVRRPNWPTLTPGL